MKYTPVQSSNLYSVGYDETKQEMEVTFKDKQGNPTTTYLFFGVPASVHSTLISSQTESKGSYFAKNVRNSFPYKQK